MSDRMGPKCEDDVISAAPTTIGSRARAWRVDDDVLRRMAGGGANATVAAWLVEAPWAHPLWHSYLISLIMLRPLAGLVKPIIHLDGATHEIAVFALDPGRPRELVLTDGIATFLHPANFIAQMIEDSDKQADIKVANTIGLITMGLLNPDTDFMHQWVALYGDNMLRTPERKV